MTVRHQTTDPRSSKNIKWDKHEKTLYLGISFSKYRKSKKQEEKKNLTCSRTQVRIISDFSETMKTTEKQSEIFEVLKEEKKALTQNSLTSKNYIYEKK